MGATFLLGPRDLQQLQTLKKTYFFSNFEATSIALNSKDSFYKYSFAARDSSCSWKPTITDSVLNKSNDILYLLLRQLLQFVIAVSNEANYAAPKPLYKHC